MKDFAALLVVLPLLGQPAVTSRPFRLDELKTPEGFSVSVYARVNGAARLMTFGPNGVLYVAAGSTIFAIPETNKVVLAAGRLNGAHALAFRGEDLYVSANDGIYRFQAAVTADLGIVTK